MKRAIIWHVVLTIGMAILATKVYAQNFNLGNSEHLPGWYKFGRLILPQGGADVRISISSGMGYNAQVDQNSECFIHFRTSNGIHHTNNFYGIGTYYNTGRTKVINDLTIVQIDPNTWDFYAIFPYYTGFYSVLNMESVAGQWQPAFEKTEVPAHAVKQVLLEEHSLQSDLYTVAKIGIGIPKPTERLEVNGNIRAKEIKVETTNWPDYVFEEDYRLTPLTEIESFIKANKHLPDIPSAQQIAEDGMSVGEMNKLLLKKVEELTLHLIEKDKKIEIQDNMLLNIMDRLQKLENK
ncbi:Uncharacterised protein [Sphingobacterium spiritivorum]|uniref:Uncharacterized protein n=1 Tax=Sphingobacterium spiritivorum TaxID=258 RepID=A0A380BKH1_SPHSI|nr:hypothetical protein [Sphingobacterium spiritivorum]SUJ02434.1 Uncharacterised protein [Sphingobacterium spiritivorum]